jgi:hypothetical protein
MTTGRGQPRSPSLCTAQGPAGVEQQLLRLGGGALGQAGQLTGDPPDHCLCLVAALRGAQPQLRANRAPAPAHPRYGCGPGPGCGWRRPRPAPVGPSWRSGAPPWPAARSRSGRRRVGDVGGHDRGVRTQPSGAQQLRLDSLGQQRLVAPIHRRGPAASGQLHQRGRVRDMAVERDPAEPPPRDRILDFPAQGLVAQPVAELEKQQPQVARRHPRPRTPHRSHRKGGSGSSSDSGHTSAQTGDNDELIPLTANEIRHLLAHLALAPTHGLDRRLSWSRWRRRR